MSRYNHFGKSKYATVPFDSIQIGEKFRQDFRGANNSRRKDIICIKTGDLSFIEQKSQAVHNLWHSNLYMVYSFDALTTLTNHK